MRLNIKLTENEVCEAVRYWLVNATNACDNHNLITSEVSVAADSDGKIFAEAAWEENYSQ